MNPERAARAIDTIAEGLAELSLALQDTGRPRVPSSAPPLDPLPPLTDEDAPIEPERVAAMTGGEVVRPPSRAVTAQLKKESAFTECPAHQRAWTEGKYGSYCTAQSDDPDWANDKGYCRVTPRSAGAWLKQHPQGAAA